MANDWAKRNPEKYKIVRAKNRAKRRGEMDEIKLARGCIDCGYNLAPEALHFDHRDPAEKEFSVGLRIWSSWAKLLVEMAKCDVRCANCHAIRTRRMGHHVKKDKQ